MKIKILGKNCIVKQANTHIHTHTQTDWFHITHKTTQKPKICKCILKWCVYVCL